MKAIKVGDVAPDFELPDQAGAVHRLTEELKSGPVVLFFYPAAMTAGCTKEACHFRDLASEFAGAGARRLGISMDSVSKQDEFAQAHDLDYPLLSDTAGSVAEAYGVRRRLLVPLRRTTFVIDRDRVVREVIASELNMDVHADRALQALSDLATG